MQLIQNSNGPPHDKNGLRGFANNKGADQPVQTDLHLCYRLLESIIIEPPHEISNNLTF